MESVMSVCRADEEEEEQRNHPPHPSPLPLAPAAELLAGPPNETPSPNSESNDNDDESNHPDDLSPEAALEGEAPTSGGDEEADAGANGEQQGVDDASGQSPQYQNGEGATEVDDDEDAPAQKKQKSLSSLPDAAAAAAFSTPSPATASTPGTNGSTKKPKKKSNNVWTKPTSRKSKKKTKPVTPHVAAAEDTVLITPISRFPDKSDDSPDSTICLSRTYKAEKVELSDDRLTAGSTKGYRMVRATRGVLEGAWYFEIKVVRLGETGHTRLGWTTDKGDLQAPVGYDGNSFGYRDTDGSKVHKALREKYGEEGYREGDVVGCYINLPDGKLYAPKPPNFVWYKGQRYLYPADGKDEPPKVVPGSEISFFRNGLCQGVAFTELFGGRYYPAASMYTLPDQPNCEVRFNFGPNFEFFPEDFGDRPIPGPMIEVPYHGFDGKVEASTEKGLPEKKDPST